jgi:hypothetical protein
VRCTQASALFRSKARKKGSVGEEAGRIPKWERSHHDSITVHGRHLDRMSRSSALRGVALTCAVYDPSTTSIASRIRSPVRGKDRCDRCSVEPGDKRCPGVG